MPNNIFWSAFVQIRENLAFRVAFLSACFVSAKCTRQPVPGCGLNGGPLPAESGGGGGGGWTGPPLWPPPVTGLMTSSARSSAGWRHLTLSCPCLSAYTRLSAPVLCRITSMDPTATGGASLAAEEAAKKRQRSGEEVVGNDGEAWVAMRKRSKTAGNAMDGASVDEDSNVGRRRGE